MLARATLEDDGVRFHYQFSNRSSVVFDMIYAVTDPRLTSIFHEKDEGKQANWLRSDTAEGFPGRQVAL